MKVLKKATCILVTLMMILSMAACGKSKDNNDKPEKPSVEQDLPDDSKTKEEGSQVSTEEDFMFEEVEGGVSITSYVGEAPVVNIPDTLDGKSVVGISNGAFSGKEEITEVKVPNSVLTIGSEAFQGCVSLIDFAFGNSVAEIGEFAFFSCTSLKSIVIPESVVKIGSGLFSSCEKLESIEFKAKVDKIADGAFCMTNISRFEVPETVTLIDKQAFLNCMALQEVIIPASVTAMEDDVFEDSPNVTIVGQAGSYAETFANAHSIPFQAK